MAGVRPGFLKKDPANRACILDAGFFATYRQDELALTLPDAQGNPNALPDMAHLAGRRALAYQPRQDPWVRRVQEDPGPVAIPPARLNNDQRNFLADGLENVAPYSVWYNQMNWRGSKLLGAGGMGEAYLFERISAGSFQKIVIKRARQGFNLDNEVNILTRLRLISTGPSDHIVNIIANPLLHLRAPNMPVSFVAVTNPDCEYYAMEFCEGGSLESVLEKRIVKQRNNQQAAYFSEANLWAIFSCLVRAINVLDHGTENETPLPGRRGWNPIIHFDIKPENILIGKIQNRHQSERIHKLHDFGLAKEKDRQWSRKRLQELRKTGTEGYYTPEQFTERWDYQDPFGDRVGGYYGTHTNIWQIGAVMWQLALLSGPPPAKHFTPTSPPHSPILVIGGNTYGERLLSDVGHQVTYSMTLRVTILRCLHEKPDSRPGLPELRNLVNAGKLAAAQWVVNDCSGARPGRYGLRNRRS